MYKGWIVFIVALCCYGYAFSEVDSVYATDRQAYLSPPPSEVVLKGGLPYLQQLTGEVLYVKTAVYIGSVLKYGLSVSEEVLATNFETMQTMHPYLFDVYHIENAYMRDFGDAYVKRSITMLKDGMEKLPQEWRLPFYIAFNYFYYLKDNESAYNYLLRTTELTGNIFFTHLASVLSAKDGNLKAGLVWLMALYDNEVDEQQKELLLMDAKAYKAAIFVQDQVNEYHQKEGKYPVTLDDLMPSYMEKLPGIEANFEIVYDAKEGLVKIKRPGET